MKKQNTLLKAGIAVVMAGMLGTTANADVANGAAQATLVAPLSITENIAMNFGTLSGGPAAGTVVLTTAGARSSTGDAQVLAVVNGTAGDFTITGDTGQNVIISSTDGRITDALGNNPMDVVNFTDTLTGTGDLNGTATLPGATVTFQVGATLNVNANQPAGNYSTANGGGLPYTITVNYN